MKDKNRLISSLLVLVISLTFLQVSVFANEAPKLTIDGKSAIILEPGSGKILLEQNADERLPIASVTKVMTILLIYEALGDGRIGLDDIVTVSEHAAGMGGSQVFLEVYEKQTVSDLLKSVVIASANDASVALAEFIAGSEETFVDQMNRKAAELGMKNSSFKNACGLDADGHFSSARDVALMTSELVKNHPQIFELSKTWMDNITHKTARGEEEFGLTNTNKLVKWYKGATGLKTGSTSKALYCLSGTAERDGLSIIAVVLGSPNPNIRFQEVMKMFDYTFANFKSAKGLEKGESVGNVVVLKGVKDTVEAIVKDIVTTVVPKKSGSELEHEIQLYENIGAPILKGDKVGEINYKYNGENVGSSDLVSVEDVKQAEILDIISKLFKLWFK